LTLGAWIDLAIKKSTGLAPASPIPVSSTTASTTLAEPSPDVEGVSPEGEVSSTPELETLPSQSGGAVEATPPSSLDDAASNGLPPMPGLQVDPEERFGAAVDTVAGPSTRDWPSMRDWPSLPGLRGARAPMAGVAVLAVIIVAGLMVYVFAFSGSDDRDSTTPAAEAIAAAATTTPSPPTPDPAHRGDTEPPPEPGVIEMLTAAAEQGDAVAQHDLAVRYLDGKIVSRDNKLALKWLERAASQGMAAAQHRLAAMYADGQGVAADANRAAMWHTRAASQGHPGSQHALALAYASGRGVNRSEASAVEWLGRAARSGNAASQARLAERYETGRGVARDAGKAAEWYRRAAAKGDAGAAARLKELAATTAPTPPAPTPPAPTTAATEPALAGATLLDRLGVAEVQRLLARLAFRPGPADGILGARTVREIKLYQSFAGLPDDGKATLGLVRELREMVRGMSSATEPPGR
jgi:TPR repeat protein